MKRKIYRKNESKTHKFLTVETLLPKFGKRLVKINTSAIARILSTFFLKRLF